MHLSTFVLIALLPAASLARSHHHPSRLHSPKRHNLARDSGYKLQTKYQGQNFFDGWDFYTGDDPTHGNAQYESREDSSDIAYVQDDGTVVVRVDNKTSVPAGGSRRSVRISTTETYNGGLFIADFSKFAHGPSTWPAFWTVGPGWPDKGEIDIMEYVNNATVNQLTLHTGGSSPDCKLDPNVTARYQSSNCTHDQYKNFLGHPLGLECRSSDGNNAGCAVNDFEGSAGQPFNEAGGGVIAMLWDNTQVTFWRFERSAIPQDIEDGNPDPNTWGIPVGYWSDQTCDIAGSFQDHSIVINIAICGDWAGPAYANSGFPGVCSDAVANSTNYDAALIEINQISVYQKA